MKELQIKTILVEHLLKVHVDAVIGSELAFQYGQRRADIFSLIDDKATSYEIKGANDSTDKLSYQLESYKSYFDYCYVVCELSNLAQVRKLTPKSVGIYVIANNELKVLRKSHHFRRLNKEYLCSTLPIVLLQKLVNGKTLRSKHDLCSYIAKHSTLREIRRFSRQYLAEKYSPSSRQLRREVKWKINTDDLLTITRMPPTSLFRRSVHNS